MSANDPVSHDDPKRQFVSFAFVGVAGLVVDISVLHVTQMLGMDRYSGRVCSYLAAATTTWALNRRFTFKGRRSRNAFAEWARFLGANAVGGVLNYGTYAALVTWSSVVATYPSIGVAAGSIAGMMANFTLSRRLVFHKRNSDAA